MDILLGAGFILFLLWLLGLITAHTLGGGIHILLALAVVSFIVWLIVRLR
jgi:hypothetical protein